MTKANMIKSLAVAGILAATATLTVGQVAFGQTAAARAGAKDAARALRGVAPGFKSGASGAAAAGADKSIQNGTRAVIGAGTATAAGKAVKTTSAAANDANYAGATVCNFPFLNDSEKAAGRAGVAAGILDASCGASMGESKEGEVGLKNTMVQVGKVLTLMRVDKVSKIADASPSAFARYVGAIDLRNDGEATRGEDEVKSAVSACADKGVFAGDFAARVSSL